MESTKASATLKDPAAQVLRDRARLVELGRQDGISEARLARALRAGNVSKLKAVEHRPAHTPRKYVAAFDASAFDQVANAFLEEVTLTAWPGLNLEDLRSPSRLRRFAWPRHVLTLLLRELAPGASFPTVAAYLGRDDHTSAIYAAERAAEVFQRSPLFVEVADKVRARFKEES